MKHVSFQTDDGVTIVGSWLTPAHLRAVVLCLHMMPNDRHSWNAFQQALLRREIASLAIDLRGHGESIKSSGSKIDYHLFTDAEHKSSYHDVQASLAWIRQKIADPLLTIGIVGASIGANLTLLEAVRSSSIRAIALLSPGENYRGLRTFEASKKLSRNVNLLTVGSAGDDQESFNAAKHIVELAPCMRKTFLSFENSGHGTNLFTTHPEFIEGLASWFEKMESFV